LIKTNGQGSLPTKQPHQREIMGTILAEPGVGNCTWKGSLE
jgi:hypothetical protein